VMGCLGIYSDGGKVGAFIGTFLDNQDNFKT